MFFNYFLFAFLKANSDDTLSSLSLETLLNSVLIAQSEKSEVKVASNDSFVVNTRKGSAEVNLQRGTSTSKKFIEGNYADFGIADEYMISAAEHASPYERLKRALVD